MFLTWIIIWALSHCHIWSCCLKFEDMESTTSDQNELISFALYKTNTDPCGTPRVIVLLILLYLLLGYLYLWIISTSFLLEVYWSSADITQATTDMIWCHQTNNISTMCLFRSLRSVVLLSSNLGSQERKKVSCGTPAKLQLWRQVGSLLSVIVAMNDLVCRYSPKMVTLSRRLL